MSTVSLATLSLSSDNLCQGDVFKNVRYSYIDKEDNENVDIVEYTFPMAVIISQACDVIEMSKMISQRSGKPIKFMPSVLMCPIYDKETAKNTQHLDQVFKELSITRSSDGNEKLFSSKEYDVVSKDWHYRFHSLAVKINKKLVLEDAIIDFKHYFTIPASYLVNNRQDRLFRIDDIYAEQLTLKFATFLSRVAIPDVIDESTKKDVDSKD